MTFRDFTSRAAKCRTMMDLERLFVEDRPKITDKVPDWRYLGLWNLHRDRIEGDGQTGEVCETLPF